MTHQHFKYSKLFPSLRLYFILHTLPEAFWKHPSSPLYSEVYFFFFFLAGWRMARLQQSNAPDTTWVGIPWLSGMLQKRMLASTRSSYETRNTDSTRISRSHLWLMVRNNNNNNKNTSSALNVLSSETLNLLTFLSWLSRHHLVSQWVLK